MATSAEMSKRRRRGALTREITYQKVLLAVYMLSDEDGLVCRAYNTTLARQCGCSVGAATSALEEMERRGVVEAFDWRDGISCRMIILMDSPKAPEMIDVMRGRYSCRPRRV